MNHFIIGMNFITCNFEDLEKEWTENGKIMWEVKGSLDSKERIINRKGRPSNPSKLKKGTIVYFYVFGIPSSSGKKKSRILLRGEVVDEPHAVLHNEVYLRSGKTDKIIGFSIGNLTTLKKEQLNNDNYLSLDDLREKDSDFKYPRGNDWPNDDERTSGEKLSTKIIDILESSFKKESYENDFKSLIKHFSQKCYFDNGENKKEHKTFNRRNGTDYFEYHHFIQQHQDESRKNNNGKKDEMDEIDKEKLSKIINAPENRICLCSNCHRKIHYGQVAEVSEMLNKLWEDADIQAMLKRFNFSSLALLKGKDPLDWIKSTYNIKDDV